MIQTLLRTTVTVVLTLVALPVRPAARRLCIDGECREYKCGAAFTASDSKRTFVYGSPGTEYRLGVIAAGDRLVSCEAFATGIELRISPQAVEALDLRILDPAAKFAWQIPFSVGDLAKPIKLSLAQGTYEIVVSAPHRVPFRKTVASRRKPESVTVTLVSLPRLTGTVVDGASGRRIPRVRVTTDTGCAAVADDNGHFSIEPQVDHWPKTISIDAVGFGEKTLVVPSARADVMFDDIYVMDASSLTIEITGRDAARVVAVDLQKLRYGGRASGPTVKTIDVSKNPSETNTKLSLESVDAGQYAVVARGKEAWQRYSRLVTVSAHDKLVVPLQIDPFDLHFAVQHAPVDDGRSQIILSSRDGFWEATLPLVHNAADVSLWQGGSFGATLHMPGMTPFTARKSIADGVSSDWIVDFPSTEVAGTVTDSATAAPIPNAAVALRMRANDGYGMSVSTRAGQDGSFRFSPVMPGTHNITAAAKGYPPADTSYVFGESESIHTLNLTLTRSPSVTLTVTDARGLAVANARIIDAQPGVGTIGRTNANGATPIYFPSDAPRQLFIVPMDGSLGFAVLGADVPEASVTVPDGNARIVLHAETTTHEPLMAVAIDMRYNGIRVPDEVMEALAGRGSRTATDAQGRIVLEHMPTGTYQFWPIASRSDVDAVKRGRPPAVTLNVTPGENGAVMTFAP